MTDSPGDVLNLIRDNEVQIVDLRFVDLPGPGSTSRSRPTS